MLAGASVIRGSELRLRAKSGNVQVKAPARFLKALYEWCDGTRTSAEIQGGAQARWGASRFASFMGEMLECGVLVDASRMLDAHLEATDLVDPFDGACAEQREAAVRRGALRAKFEASADTLLPSSRAPLLGKLLDTKPSAVGFGSGTVGARQLANLLDAVGSIEPLRISVVLIRAVGRFRAGIYDVHVPRQGRVAMERIADDDGEWCRALLEAHRWLSATGLLIVSARALQFALLEAGAALQNGHLAAAETGLAFRISREYDPSRLRRVCRLDAERVLGCAIFGAPPKRVARTGQARHSLRFSWGEGAGGRFHVAGAEVVGCDVPSSIGWGRSLHAPTACAIAVSEAVERYSYAKLGPCVEAIADELEGSIDPRALVPYADDQYRSRRLRVKRFDPSRRYLWVPATDLQTGRTAWVPAECAQSVSALPAAFADHALARTTSSGCATNADRKTAIERAAFEVIERDALARHWLTQLPGTLLRGDFGATTAARLARLRASGCGVSIVLLEARFGPVVVVVVESETKGFSALGSACGADMPTTLEHALTEAEVLSEVRLRMDDSPRVKASEAWAPLDHSNLYAMRRHFRRARALTHGGATTTLRRMERKWPRSLRERLSATTNSLGRHMRPSMWIDLTQSDAPLGPAGKELQTVRVLIPGCLPIGFGHDAIPRGGIGPIGAAGRFPHPLA